MANTLKGITAGEYGKNIVLTLVDSGTAVNISSYSTITVEFKHDKGDITRTAAFVTDGTNGQIQFSFGSASDQNLPYEGTWKGQVILYKTGELSRSEVFEIKVEEGLD